MISSIPVGSSISPEGFLSSILLVVVIIIMVVIVVVILLVVVVEIVGVVIVVTIFGVVVVVDGVSCYVDGFLQSLRLRGSNISFNTSGVEFSVGQVFLLGLLAFSIDAACAFRAEEMPSLISCWMPAKVMAGVSDVDVLLGGILSIEDNT
ncbi:hypothetical protein Tco_0751580 [Tanacetum coccineum]|uniref:Uncharacterized protein n=1 Tax=Tanacetum coccineum TaxID=301880 RepID=A0ABQ4Z4M3_9ASTR